MHIAKTFDFDAAHWLPHVPDDHKCRRLHGHTYRVEVVCAGEVNPYTGMVCDYADIAALWAPLHDLLDHRLLNDIPGLENPTTELLAAFVFAALVSRDPLVVAVRVYESSSTYCECSR